MIVLLTCEIWRRASSRMSELPVTTTYWLGGVFLPVSMSSTQCPAVRTKLGAITVPEQLKPSPFLLAARMKAAQGHSSLRAVLPPTIEAVASGEEAAAGPARASDASRAPSAPQIHGNPRMQTRVI